jgi:hypothetical protein
VELPSSATRDLVLLATIRVQRTHFLAGDWSKREIRLPDFHSPMRRSAKNMDLYFRRGIDGPKGFYQRNGGLFSFGRKKRITAGRRCWERTNDGDRDFDTV